MPAPEKELLKLLQKEYTVIRLHDSAGAMAIRDVATVRNDECILRKVSGPDAIAAVARYHGSCYSGFTDR